MPADEVTYEQIVAYLRDEFSVPEDTARRIVNENRGQIDSAFQDSAFISGAEIQPVAASLFNQNAAEIQNAIAVEADARGYGAQPVSSESRSVGGDLSVGEAPEPGIPAQFDGAARNEWLDQLKSNITEAPEAGGLTVRQTVSGEVADEWLENNASLIDQYISQGLDPETASEQVRREMMRDVHEAIERDIAERVAEGTLDESVEAIYFQEYAQWGLDETDMARISGQVTYGLNTQKIYSDPDWQATAASLGFHGDDNVREWLDFAADQLRQSSDPNLAAIGDRDHLGVLSFITNENLWENIDNRDEAERVQNAIFSTTEAARTFGYDYGNGLVYEREWQRIAGMDGYNDPSSERIVTSLFRATANSGLEENAAEMAPFVALVAKDRGILDAYHEGEGLPAFLPFQQDPQQFVMGPPEQAPWSPFQGGFSPARTPELPGFQSPDWPTPAGVSPVPGPSDFAAGDPRQGMERAFESAAGAVAGEFGRAMERYGRQELALIALYDPGLAERIYQNGSPQSEAEAHQVQIILSRFDDEDLAQAGFFDNRNAPYVQALTTVNAGGTGGTTTTVNLTDSAQLSEAFIETYRTMMMDDPDDAEVQAFVNSIHAAERQRDRAVADTINANPYNIWQGTGGVTSDQLNQTIERMGVNPEARFREQMKSNSTYQALYAHLPRGVSEVAYQNSFRSKVGEVVGDDDVAFNLDAVRYGMMIGDPRQSMRSAFTQNLGSDQTVRNRMDTAIRAIRSMV